MAEEAVVAAVALLLLLLLLPPPVLLSLSGAVPPSPSITGAIIAELQERDVAAVEANRVAVTEASGRGDHQSGIFPKSAPTAHAIGLPRKIPAATPCP